MRFAIVLIGELAGQEGIPQLCGQGLGLGNTAQKAALGMTHQHDVRAEAANQVFPFIAHPVRHEDRHRVAHGPPHSRKSDPGIAAGRFDNHRFGLEYPALLSLAQDVIGHPVLDAAGQVEILGFGKQDALLSPIRQPNLQQRRIADQCREILDSSLMRRARHGVFPPQDSPEPVVQFLLLSNCHRRSLPRIVISHRAIPGSLRRSLKRSGIVQHIDRL